MVKRFCLASIRPTRRSFPRHFEQNKIFPAVSRLTCAVLQDKGTKVFAVGVGNYNLMELQAVASDPNCSHVMTLTSFDHIQSILTQIQKSACEGESDIKHCYLDM